jgi:hypothetical protein
VVDRELIQTAAARLASSSQAKDLSAVLDFEAAAWNRQAVYGKSPDERAIGAGGVQALTALSKRIFGAEKALNDRMKQT